MPKKRKQIKKDLALILILLGVIFFVFGTILRLLPESFSTSGTQFNISNPPEYASPKKITFPSLKLDVNIIQGGIINGEWVLDDKKALFLPTSGNLGEGFNTIIYAHKREGLFLNLRNLQIGDKIWVADQKNRTFFYKVISKEEIIPTEVEKLKSEIPDTLTLFTCDGIFDQSRLLVRAKREFLDDDLLTTLFLKPNPTPKPVLNGLKIWNPDTTNVILPL